jgi:hypothetical protein
VVDSDQLVGVQASGVGPLDAAWPAKFRLPALDEPMPMRSILVRSSPTPVVRRAVALPYGRAVPQRLLASSPIRAGGPAGAARGLVHGVPRSGGQVRAGVDRYIRQLPGVVELLRDELRGWPELNHGPDGDVERWRRSYPRVWPNDDQLVEYADWWVAGNNPELGRVRSWAWSSRGHRTTVVSRTVRRVRERVSGEGEALPGLHIHQGVKNAGVRLAEL